MPFGLQLRMSWSNGPHYIDRSHSVLSVAGLRIAMTETKDPRVLFAAERTLLAWNRTSIALIAFGFVVERSGLLMSVLMPERSQSISHWLTFAAGVAFVILGVITAIYSSAQYANVLRNLKPNDFPDGYATKWGIYINVAVALVGFVLVVALYLGY